tara:strand:+ start:1257 stop:1448 length:192 start_codon:yes stop_codon:yes gene_type:complete
MTKLAKDLKEGDKVKLAGQVCTIKKLEMSDIGKHGKKKCRIELSTEKGEKMVIIRPEDYPFNI